MFASFQQQKANRIVMLHGKTGMRSNQAQTLKKQYRAEEYTKKLENQSM